MSANEEFQQDFPMPAETPPGAYQVVAISGEGEQITAELTVDAVLLDPIAATKPSDALMQLDRRKSSGELAAIIVVLVFSAGLGLVLVRRR